LKLFKLKKLKQKRRKKKKKALLGLAKSGFAFSSLPRW
jgi:hypothetical protein